MKKLILPFILLTFVVHAGEPIKRNKGLIVRVNSCKENTPNFPSPEPELDEIQSSCPENMDCPDCHGLTECPTYPPIDIYPACPPSMEYPTCLPSGICPTCPPRGIYPACPPSFEEQFSQEEIMQPFYPVPPLYIPETPPFPGKVEVQHKPPAFLTRLPVNPPLSSEKSTGSLYYLKHKEGRWLENDLAYSTIGVLATLGWKTSLHPFLDVRLHISRDQKIGGNVGLGLRVPIQNATWGLNIFYDFWKKKNRSMTHQLGVGLEWLGSIFDIRINSYIPLHSSQRSNKHIFEESGFTYKTLKQRKALTGVDAEIGYWLKHQSLSNSTSIYTGVGLYYYDSKNKKILVGGTLRLQTTFGRYFTLLGMGGYDKVFHGSGLVALTLTYPFSPSCGDKFFLPVFRQEMILLDRKEQLWNWNW